MILTEDEAKKKWCPEVRTGLTAGMSVHHVGSSHADKHAGDVHEETRCVASGCMMWRWLEGEFKKVSTEVWIPKGYCGKAGRP